MPEPLSPEEHLQQVLSKALLLEQRRADRLIAKIEKNDTPARRRVCRMLNGIVENLQQPYLTVRWLRSYLAIYRNSTVTLFRALVGLRPFDYIEAARFRVAKKLLRKTREPIWRVAMLTGYSHRWAFSKAFARHVGIRPNWYRSNRLEKYRPGSRPSIDDKAGSA
jgi:transcriptional regulator GlxA family with amidase domain